MSARGTPVLLNRDEERRVLDGLIERARGRRSAVLVVRGEAGIGKTALLRDCARRASGFRVAWAAGVESEMELPFAGLHQLCAPMLDRLDGLPAPQRAALAVALGVESGAPPDRFLIGLATLSLLAKVAEERPLLCVVEDAQWLDAASGQVLGFVGRRLVAESVALMFAVRDPSAPRELAGLPDLALDGLPELDARTLLATVVPGRLDERLRNRLIAETRGNPLALLELPHDLAASHVPVVLRESHPRSLTERLEAGFVRQLDALSPNVRRLLLVAAAEPIDDPPLIWRAAERLGLNPSLAAESNGLLQVDEHVVFRHPLVRAAVYRSAPARERQAVHLALAEAADAETDADRRAWHRAAAATGPDEEIASELERSASRAQARGGLTAAAAFLRRSFALTRDPAQRGQRALAAAQASLQAGAFDAARGLLGVAASAPLDDFQRAQIDLWRGRVAFASGLGSDAPPLLLKAAQQLESHDPTLARETYLNAWGAAVFAGGDVLLDICRAARSMPPPAEPPRPLEALLDGLTWLVTDGHAAATPTLQQAAAAFDELPRADVLHWGWAARAAAALVWDFDEMSAIAARQVRLVRDAGALAQLPLHLSQLALARVWMGEFSEAESLVAESDSVAAATGSKIAPYTDLRLRSLQGRQAETITAIAGAHAHAAAEGQGMASSWAHWAGAVLANGLGRHHDAVLAAQQATSDGLNPFMSMWALPELVEAAAHVGDDQLARTAFARLAKTTEHAGADAPRGIEARCGALVSEGGAAEELFREAVDRLSRTRVRPELARAHLLYGEWLHREGRRDDARTSLHVAHSMLAGIGMEAFADRARRGLLATGANVQSLPRARRDDLSAQERQIAQLAEEGLSNPEIGAQLFLSPRTVEWHLSKVFAKLGIRSRRELAEALSMAGSEEPSRPSSGVDDRVPPPRDPPG
jgi:DNA-binding CsgD family transcriptional regulator